MKIYEEYKKLLKTKFDAGFSLSKTWFTTFTLSPEFFESYLLPPLLQQEDEVPKSYLQFEEMIAKLTETRADIKVFYDASMPIDGIKKTTVAFIGVIHPRGLFHPKLTLLEFEKGGQTDSYIMVGSANISVSGWARNREGVVFRKIETDSQLEQVNAFFAGFYQQQKEIKSRNNLRAHHPQDWGLIHTNSGFSFLDAIKNLNMPEWLVWSPYFSGLDFFTEVRNELKGTEVKVIPDLVGMDKKVRMTDIGHELFYSDGQGQDERFNHAKLWLSQDYLIVGSHNFTREALIHKNYEVSILEPATSDFFNQVKLSPLGDINVMSKEECEQEALPSGKNHFVFELEVDHEKKTILLLVDRLKNVEANYLSSLKLPGNTELKKLTWHGSTKKKKIELALNDELKFWRGLVTEKTASATIIDKQGKTLHGECFIFEVNCDERQPFRYGSLYLLMLDELQQNKSRQYSKNLVHASELSGIEDQSSSGFVNKYITIDYFKMYAFFAKFRHHVDSIKNQKDFHRLVIHSASSLYAIKELIKAFEVDAQHHSTMFLTLMKQEYNQLISYLVGKKKNLLGPNTIQDLKKLRFKIHLDKAQRKFLTTSAKIKQDCHHGTK